MGTSKSVTPRPGADCAWWGRYALALLVLTQLGCPARALADGREIGVHVAALYGGSELKVEHWPSAVSLGDCTGVLVHPEVVVYAGHCGSAYETIEVVGRERAVERCETRTPEAVLVGDLAYCILREPVRDAAPVRITMGCERIERGQAIVLVGFGLAGDARGPGDKQLVRSTLVELGPELLVRAPGTGTCIGDSGGPAYVGIEDGFGDVDWSVVGILSSGDPGCAPNDSYYTPVYAYLPWLEQHSGRDLTPCGDAEGNWSPGPDCVATEPHGEDREGTTSRRSRACGAPFDPGTDHASAPCSVSRPGSTPPNGPGWACAGLALCVVGARRRHTIARRRRRASPAQELASPWREGLVRLWGVVRRCRDG